MHHISSVRRRFRALAPAAVLLLALCLLAGGAQAAYTPGTPRYVAGDILEITASNVTSQIVIAKVDTTSLPTPYYTAYDVVENAGRWEIPSYWNHETRVDEQNLVENLHAQRVGHVDPVLVIITDQTITGGDMLYYGLSLSEANAGVIYSVEPAPGDSGLSPIYIVGDILGNVSDPTNVSVVTTVFQQDDGWWYRTYFHTARSGDRWMIEKYYNGDISFREDQLAKNDMRRVAHADPHIVIINDSTTSTGEIGWYLLSLAEVHAGKGYDHMGSWHFVTGDILGNETAQYIVTNATTPQLDASHYTLREVVRGADGWEIPNWVNGGFDLEVAKEAQLDAIPFTFDDHTDPHFAVVTDPSVENGVTYLGLSLGEILEGTPGYPVETPPPVGGDKGYFLVSTTPAGAAIYLEDISGTRYLEGNTTNGALNVSIYLTATPMRKIIANLTGYRDAVYNITNYPAKGETVPVTLTLEPLGPQPYRPLSVPGKIQAEDYNLGGEGVAYHDTTPGNEGGAYRHDDVDIETVGGVTDVGWIRNGEYLTYTANVTQAGNYTLTARTASPNSGRTMAFSVDGTQTATIAVPNTGAYERFATVPVPVTLAAGTHVLKLTFQGDGQNLDWIAFGPSTTPTVTSTPTPTPTAGGASFTAAPLTAPHGAAVKFTLAPATGKTVSAAWWSFDAPAHLNTWNSRAVNPTFFYPAAGTFSPLVKITYSDGSTETVQRTGYIRAT
ncbi:MAG: carbohydrate-binding protein [Methanospirillum sp.]